LEPDLCRWFQSNHLDGTDPDTHYCAPTDSEVVKMNAKPDPTPQYVRVTDREALSYSPQDWWSGMFYIEGPDYGWYSVVLNQVLCDEGGRPIFGTSLGDYRELWKKAKPTKPEPEPELPKPEAYIVWCPNRGEPTKKQPSFEAAKTEAQRLAAKHPGSVFHVCQIVAGYVGEVTVKHVEL
jgi:hypothetical protein